MNRELAARLREGGGLVVRRAHPELRHPIATAVRRGQLERVAPGIYAIAGRIDTRLRCRALMLADPDAVIIGEVANDLLLGEHVRERPVRAISRRLRWRRGFALVDRRLDPELVTEVDGLRVSVPALTALDRVATTGPEAIDDALRRGIPLDELWRVLSLVPNRPGNADIRRVLRDSRDEPWSEAERAAHRALRDAGVDGWQSNYRVALLNGATAFLDVAFSDCQLAFEIDGYEFHSGRLAFEGDRRRDVQLSLTGWRVHRFDATVVLDHPEEFAAAVASLLFLQRRRRAA